MQSLPGRSRWNADAVRDETLAYTVEVLGDDEGALVVDETEF